MITCVHFVLCHIQEGEKSRDPQSILEECKKLVVEGYKEVTLLGQNVDHIYGMEGEKKNIKMLLKKKEIKALILHHY